MKLASHLILTAPLVGFAAIQGGILPAALLYGGAVLIDVDHFIFYALRTGRYNPIEMFSWYDQADKHCTSSSYYGLNIFHTAEVFALISVAASFWPVLSWLLLGMGFHFILDIIWLYRHPTISVKVRAFSWIEHLVRRWRGEREFWRDGQT
jgi:hypothetical protein